MAKNTFLFLHFSRDFHFGPYLLFSLLLVLILKKNFILILTITHLTEISYVTNGLTYVTNSLTVNADISIKIILKKLFTFLKIPP